jgi:predicted DNA-binding transcriptional regulator AlpA/DNA-binding XRE family transcriptional regulator
MDNIRTATNIGDRVSKLRERQGLSIAALATAAGLTEDDLRASEAGSRDFGITELDRLANALGVELEHWFRSLPTNRTMLTVDQVAERLGNSRGTLANWRVLNNKGVEIGPKWFKLTPQIVRYYESDVEAWIAAQSQASA